MRENYIEVEISFLFLFHFFEDDRWDTVMTQTVTQLA